MTPNDIAACLDRENKQHLANQRIAAIEPFLRVLATFAVIGVLAVVVLLILLAKSALFAP